MTLVGSSHLRSGSALCNRVSVVMASSAPPGSSAGVQNSKKSLGFIANAVKRKDSFIQFFAMTGILLLSVRSLGQKYRLHNLQEDTTALKEEQEALAERTRNIKRDLLHEASLEPTGLFASRLRLLFGEREWSHCEFRFWGFLLFIVTLCSYSIWNTFDKLDAQF